MKSKYNINQKIKFYYIDEWRSGVVCECNKIRNEYYYIVRPNNCKYKFYLSESELKRKE